MQKHLENLIRVTGWGTIYAKAFLATCEPSELALIEEGKVQAAMDAKADREAQKDGYNYAELTGKPSDEAEGDPPAIVLSLNESKLHEHVNGVVGRFFIPEGWDGVKGDDEPTEVLNDE